MDRVLALLQIDAAHGGAFDATVWHEADAISGAGSVERMEVFQPKRALLDGEPAELVRVIVDGAGGARLPAEREQLEELVAIDEIARVPPGSEVEERLQRLRADAEVVQQLADVSRTETRRRDASKRLDDPFDCDEHVRTSAPALL